MIKTKSLSKEFYKLFFILPSIGLLIIFYITPNILNIYYSFTNWSPYSENPKFVGLTNFIDLFTKEDFLHNLFITVKYAVIVCIIVNIFALFLALMLEEQARASRTLRTIMFIPVLISDIAASFIFISVLSKNGITNSFISFITGRNIEFVYLGNIRYVLYFVILVQCWRSYGIPFLVYLAGLNLIPEELIEAAKVEGASTFKIITKIKLPLLGPAFTFNLITNLIGTLSVFSLPIAMTMGGPARATEVINILVFRLFGVGRWGVGTSVSMFLLLIVIIFSIPIINYLKSREVEL